MESRGETKHDGDGNSDREHDSDGTTRDKAIVSMTIVDPISNTYIANPECKLILS